MAPLQAAHLSREIHITESGDECRVRFEWLLAQEDDPALLIDVCFAWCGDRAARRPGDPTHAIEFKRPASHRAIYEEHFRCDVKFDAPNNVLVFKQTD